MSIVHKSRGYIEAASSNIGTQFMPLAICPLPPKPVKKPMGEDWIKTVGATTVRIVASSQHGIPFGRDILVVLYLIQEAQRQGNRVIQFDNLSHYLQTFKIDDQGNNYREAIERFKRIFYSTWFWEDEREDGGRTGISFRIVQNWSVFFDPQKSTNTLFKNFIEITPEAWEIVQRHPIPYRLDAVIALKNKPATLGLYLYLVYRTWNNWNSKAGREFVPFFGDNGLQKQLSSDIARVDNFRMRFKGWLDEIREVWPDCPVELERIGYEQSVGRWHKKQFKDGLFIEVKSVDQLHVGPHWPKELRLAKEQAAAEQAAQEEAERKAIIKPCPQCGEPMHLRPGIVHRGSRLPDYFRCAKCGRNFNNQSHPELFKNEE